MAVSGRLWFAGALLAIAAGVAVALWRAPHTVTPPATAQPDDAPVAPPSPAPPVLASAAPPPGLDADSWQALRSDLAGRPAELQRLAAYYRYADQFQRFRDRRTTAPRAELLPRAQALDEGLDERLRQRELSAGEARLVKLAVLEVLLPDDGQRQAALARWQAALPAAAPNPLRVAREAEFQRRQSEIVAAWSNAPQRDPQALERDLDALRQAHFGAPTTGPGASR